MSLETGAPHSYIQWAGVLLLDLIIMLFGGILGSVYGAWPLGAFACIAEVVSWVAKVRRPLFRRCTMMWQPWVGCHPCASTMTA